MPLWTFAFRNQICSTHLWRHLPPISLALFNPKRKKTFCLFYRKTVSQTRQYLGQAERDAARNNRGMGSQRENVFVVGRSLHNNMSRRENNILLQYISLCILSVLGEFKRDEPAYAWSYNRKKKIKANNYYLNSPTSSLLLQESLYTNMIEPN